MVERVFPGVYLTEVACSVRPIDGVSTSTADLPGAPAWTQANQNDPGVTLLELLSWTSASLAYRADGSFEHVALHAAVGSGVVSGLALGSADGAAGLTLTAGDAVGPDGRPITAHSNTHSRRHPW